MKNKYEYILFDLDGTVTDSEEGIINSIIYSLDKMDFTGYSPALLKKFIGPPLLNSLMEEFGFSTEEAQRGVEFYREYFKEKGVFENRLYPGMEALLEKLASRNYHLLMATAKPTYYANKILEHFRIRHFFKQVTGSSMDGNILEKTDIIRIALSDHPRVPKSHFIMVGDRKHDVIGAKENGIHSLWVKYGYGEEEELKDLKPDHTAGNIDELSRFFLP